MTAEEQSILDLIQSSASPVRLDVQQSNVAYALMQGGAPIAYESGVGWKSVVKDSFTTEIVTAAPIPAVAEPVQIRQATNDDQLIRLWLHGRSPATIRAYGTDAALLRERVAKPLASVTLDDLQGFTDGLAGAVASRIRTLSSVKSLFTFGHRLGYLPFNTGAPLKLPKKKDEIAQRILTEAQVHKLLAADVSPRDKAILLLLYASGIRISELCGLAWKDAAATKSGDGILTVLGKGEKTRFVRIPESAWTQVVALRGEAGQDEAIFRSGRGGGHFDESAVFRIIKNAARVAEVDPHLSAHWLRHSHASHAIDRGAPVSLVQATLGHASLATTGRYLHARPKESSGRYLGI